MHRDDCDRETIAIGTFTGWIESNPIQRKNGSFFALKCGSQHRMPTVDIRSAYVELLDVFDGLTFEGVSLGTTRVEVRTFKEVKWAGNKKLASPFEVAREFGRLINEEVANRHQRLAVR